MNLNLKIVAPAAALIVAIGAITWVASFHLSQLDSSAALAIADASAPSTKSASTEVIGKQATVTQNMWRQIPRWHLFGTYEQKIVAVDTVEEKPLAVNDEPDLSNIPETRIPLKLSGIAFSSDERNAFAMIVTPDGHQSEYQTGESIGTEATVHLIEERRVVLNRGGKYEALSLPETANAIQNSTRTVRTQAPRAPIRPKPNQKKILIDNEQQQSDPEA